MLRPLAFVILVALVAGCGSVRGAEEPAAGDVRASTVADVSPLLSLFEEAPLLESRRVAVPSGSAAAEAFEVRARIGGRPAVFHVFTYETEGAATQESRRFPYGRAARPPASIRRSGGRAQTFGRIPQGTLVYHTGHLVVVVPRREGGLAQAVERRLGAPVR